MFPQLPRRTLDAADAALIAIGALLILAVLVRLARRRAWCSALALPPPPENRFTLLDALAAWVLLNLAAWVAYASFAPAPAGPDAASPTDPDAASAANVLSRIAAIAMLVTLGLFRVPGGLGAWGLHAARPAALLLRALLIYLAVWPVCAGLLVLAKLALRALLPDLPLDEHQTLDLLRRSAGRPAWVPAGLIASALLLAPVAEELLFRGVVQTFVARLARSPWAGVAISAVLFGLAHHGNAETILPLTFFGAALGWVYARSGSLTLVILTHVLFNSKTLLWLHLGA